MTSHLPKMPRPRIQMRPPRGYGGLKRLYASNGQPLYQTTTPRPSDLSYPDDQIAVEDGDLDQDEAPVYNLGETTWRPHYLTKGDD